MRGHVTGLLPNIYASILFPSLGMGNLFGKITTDARPLEDEINCDCSRSPTQVDNARRKIPKFPDGGQTFPDGRAKAPLVPPPPCSAAPVQEM